MKKKKYNYKNRIILINGSSFKLNSIKFFNYQLNFKIFSKKKIKIKKKKKKKKKL